MEDGGTDRSANALTAAREFSTARIDEDQRRRRPHPRPRPRPQSHQPQICGSRPNRDTAVIRDLHV